LNGEERTFVFDENGHCVEKLNLPIAHIVMLLVQRGWIFADE